MSAPQQSLLMGKGGPPGTPVDTSIKFLMSFNGDFTEANGLPVTLTSSPTISTTTTKFGSGAMNTQQVGYATATGMPSRASGDPFTLDAWFYTTGNAGGGSYILAQAHGNARIELYAEVSPNFQYYVMRLGSNVIGFQQGPVSLPLNQWVHMRGVWQSGTGYLFINGVLFDSRALAAEGGINTTGQAGPVGAGAFGGWNLFVDEVAIFNRAVTTTNFTPPTTPYARY